MPTAATPPAAPFPARRRLGAAVGAAFVGSTLIALMAPAHAAPSGAVSLVFQSPSDTVEAGTQAPPNALSVNNSGDATLCLVSLEVPTPGFQSEGFPSGEKVGPEGTLPLGTVSGVPQQDTDVLATLTYALADAETGQCADGGVQGPVSTTWTVLVAEPEPTEPPTGTPTPSPTSEPTATPTGGPTVPPTEPPTVPPTEPPTGRPTAPPTEPPTRAPSPTTSPTTSPTATESPTRGPSPAPTPPSSPEPTSTEENAESGSGSGPGPGSGSGSSPAPGSGSDPVRTPSTPGGPDRSPGSGVSSVPTSGADIPTLPRGEADLPDLAPGPAQDLADLPLVTPTSEDGAPETEIASDHTELGSSATPAVLLAAFLLALLLATPLGPTRRVRLSTGYQGKRRRG